MTWRGGWKRRKRSGRGRSHPIEAGSEWSAPYFTGVSQTHII
jgi:hypothetical protein